MAGEKTEIVIAFQSIEIPQDGAFEDRSGTTYYTYHIGYKKQPDKHWQQAHKKIQ